jgi:ankyrin repeat protein
MDNEVGACPEASATCAIPVHCDDATLLRGCADKGPLRNWPIHDSALAGDLETVKDLVLEKPSLVHKRGMYNRTALLCAASRGHLEVVRFLVEEGAPLEVVDEIKWTALHHAAATGHAAVIDYLVEQGASHDLVWA